MEIRFSPRGNGACPVCRRASSCTIRQALAASMKNITGHAPAAPTGNAPGLEVVIYSCPQFVETSQP